MKSFFFLIRSRVHMWEMENVVRKMWKLERFSGVFAMNMCVFGLLLEVDVLVVSIYCAE